QVLYSEEDVGKPKTLVAIEKLKIQNSESNLKGYETFLTTQNALQIVSEYDIVVDASDNFPTRYLVNDVCVILKKPFVYGALYGFEGQVSVFNFTNGPTYRCLFPTMPKSDEVPNCNENGVLGIIPGIIGNLQALETVKVITGIGKNLSGELLLFNGLTNAIQKIRFTAKPVNLNITQLQSSYDFECELPIQQIESEAFLQLLEKENLELIDVRTEKEYNRDHLEIAKNIPLSEIGNGQNISNFGKVYFICQSGVRSRKAIDKLQNARPNATLINVSGGMNLIRKHAVKH
ncbi:MAG: sulfurtransferase, partial [Pricia sp.]|nr:sulfurtransferase [Pricia sp.]